MRVDTVDWVVQALTTLIREQSQGYEVEVTSEAGRGGWSMPRNPHNH
jgi:hypothetical protein